MSDLSYIFKRVIIGVLIALIIMFIKNNVFAAQVTPTGINYYYSSNGSSFSQCSVSSGSTTCVVPLDYPTGLRLRFAVAIGTNKFNSSIDFQIVMHGDQSSLTPRKYVRIFQSGGGYTDISSSCTLTSTPVVTGSDTARITSFNMNMSCSFPNSNGINITHVFNDVYFDSNSGITSNIWGSQLKLVGYDFTSNPSDIDQLKFDMFLYYNSLNTQNTANYVDLRNAIDQVIDSQSDLQSALSSYQSSMESAMDLVNDNLESIETYLKDTSFDDNSGAIGDFFDTQFESEWVTKAWDERDPSTSLMSIMTFPVRLVALLNNTCQPLSFTIFSKQITLPCGDQLFWTRDFDNQSTIFNNGGNISDLKRDFYNWWNAFFGGIIIFHLLIKLYKVLQDAVDPYENGFNTLSSAIDTSDVSSYTPKHSFDRGQMLRDDYKKFNGSRMQKYHGGGK